MKTLEEIKNRIDELRHKLSTKEKEHSNMDQISMLSGEGNSLRTSINQIKGQIEALTWVNK